MQGIVPSLDPTLEEVRANREAVLKAMEGN